MNKFASAREDEWHTVKSVIANMVSEANNIMAARIALEPSMWRKAKVQSVLLTHIEDLEQFESARKGQNLLDVSGSRRRKTQHERGTSGGCA